MIKNALLKKHDIDRILCKMRYLLSEDDKIHDELNWFAKEKEVDMLLIGSQGRTRAASLLRGRVWPRIFFSTKTISRSS